LEIVCRHRRYRIWSQRVGVGDGAIPVRAPGCASSSGNGTTSRQIPPSASP